MLELFVGIFVSFHSYGKIYFHYSYSHVNNSRGVAVLFYRLLQQLEDLENLKANFI